MKIALEIRMKYYLIFFIVFGFALIAANGMLQMNEGDMYNGTPSCPNGAPLEPFLAPVQTLNIRCGVTMPTCPFDSTCANGYCVSTVLRKLKENCPIPVLP
jgi:hypothetical protein